MTDRVAGRVTVPDAVGLPFHVGREIASGESVTLANPDPDGPPIEALTWLGLFYITTQRPQADTVLCRWDSVVVEIVQHGTAESTAVRSSDEPPPHDTAHATPARELWVDLTNRPDGT
jgi:hypothetical protein